MIPAAVKFSGEKSKNSAAYGFSTMSPGGCTYIFHTYRQVKFGIALHHDHIKSLRSTGFFPCRKQGRVMEWEELQ
jgi:hypothetical protein